jgi:pimeloyl-ACP methyl ester carboxylesterase
LERQALSKADTLLAFLRHRNTSYYAISTPNGIDERRYVTVGGSPQWITIRGEDRNNPVILIVHGGPGDSMSLYGYEAFRTWEKYFTIVQWDQRGAGLSYEKTGPSVAPTMTIDRIVSDGVGVADTIRRALHQDKIIVLGHSFGSIIAVLMAKTSPTAFCAYVGTGQVSASSASMQVVAYRELLEAAKERGEGVAVRELETIGPPPFRDGRGWEISHKWANLFEHADVFLNAGLMFEMTSPGYTLSDVNAKLEGEGFSGDQLVPQTNAFDAARLGGAIDIPVLVLQGAEDFTTPGSLARIWLTSIRAPRKTFVSIPGGGHFVMFSRTDVFLDELRKAIGPACAGVRRSQ